MTNRLNFTKIALENIAPPSRGLTGAIGRSTYYDKKVNGLALRVSSAGIKTFSLYRWIPSQAKPERLTIGRFPEVTVEQARNRASQLIGRIAQGENPNDSLRAHKNEMLFSDLFALFIDRHSKPHKRTWANDIEQFERFLRSNNRGIDLASKKLSKVERTELAAMHAKIGKTNPVAANRVLALVSSVFSRAIEWGLYDKSNPASGIKKFAEQSRERFLSRGELDRFMKALGQEPNEILRDFFSVCLFTGARRSNVLSMRFSDIDLARGSWVVSAAQSKNKTALRIPLTREALTILETRQRSAASDFVFPGYGRTGHLAEPRGGWERILDRDELTQLVSSIRANGGSFDSHSSEALTVSLQRARKTAEKMKINQQGHRLLDLRPHDLRRTLGSWMAEQGDSLPLIGKMLGHRSQATTQIYSRLSLDPVREAAGRATSRMIAGGNSAITEIERLPAATSN